MKATVSEKGQITIPKAVRDKLGIVPGTVLDVESIDGKVVAEKTQALDVFTKWRGKGNIPGDIDVDEYIKETRD